jgi:uncharacterized membrane protein YcaP (DUF421 family)
MDEPVAAFDLGRMFFGREPALFLLEIAVRTIVIYVYTLTLIRWVGSRSIAQLSLVEFLLVIALGSAVGDAMFYPEVPLLHCMVVITVVVLLDKALSHLVTHSPRLEDMIEGKSVEVVRDGMIRCRVMDKSNLGHDELFEQLRLKEVANLGEVRTAYLETNGLVSVFKFPPDRQRPGLSIDPPWDVEEPLKIEAGTSVPTSGWYACPRCAGTMKTGAHEALPACPTCQGKVWHVAVAAGGA